MAKFFIRNQIYYIYLLSSINIPMGTQINKTTDCKVAWYSTRIWLRDLSLNSVNWVCPTELWEESWKEIKQSKKKMKSKYDKHRYNYTKYTIKDIDL